MEGRVVGLTFPAKTEAEAVKAPAKVEVKAEAKPRRKTTKAKED